MEAALTTTDLESDIRKPLTTDTKTSDSSSQYQEIDEKKKNRAPSTNFTKLFAPLALLTDLKFLLLIPAILYSGASQAFIAGEFPTLIVEKQWKFFVMAAFDLFGSRLG